MYRYFFIAVLSMTGGYMWGVSDSMFLAQSIKFEADKLVYGK